MNRWLITFALGSIALPVLADTVSSGMCAVPRALTRTRPDPGGEPIAIEVGIFLIDVIEVNEVDESFDVDFTLSLSWRDPRLSAAERGSSLEDCRLTLSEIWHPQVDLINQRGLALAQKIDVDIADDGTVRFSQRLTGKLSSPLDLRDFPFDSQKLRVRLASFEYGPADVRFVVRSGGGSLEGIMVPGWSITSIESDPTVDPVRSDVGDHTRLDYIITVERHSPYYFWKFVVPLIFIVFMAWCVLWLDPEDYRPAIGVSTASVFSLIAFLLGLRQMTPKVEYLTEMDRLVLSATMLVFLALGEVVVISRLVRSDRIETARRIDRHARWIYLLAVAVVIGLFFQR